MSAQVLHHRLFIARPDETLAFYQRCLGMTLLAKERSGTATHYFLGFAQTDALRAEEPQACLELIHDAERSAPDIREQPDHSEGYWKFSLAVADLDLAVACLRRQQVDVSEPEQFGDIGYLAFCKDPEGYAIELIGHYFDGNKPANLARSDGPLATRVNLSLITLRVMDIERSLAFYQQKLGMRLLSRQEVTDFGFTIYFLAFTDEVPPGAIDSVEIREWLWQRPYAQIELLHKWEAPPQAYRVDTASGFAGVRIRCATLPAGEIFDPDGYCLINKLD
jgi:catechol 2,3-dioxygenase-like lactoylglutathione lyase family enzyme